MRRRAHAFLLTKRQGHASSLATRYTPHARRFVDAYLATDLILSDPQAAQEITHIVNELTASDDDDDTFVDAVDELMADLDD